MFLKPTNKSRADAPKTGFYYFIAKFWEREKSDGRLWTFEQAKKKCNWNGLTCSQRDEYKKIAEKLGDEKVEEMFDEIKELDAQVQKIEKQKKMILENKIREFFEFVMERDYQTRSFFIAHVNYYVKTDNQFYPGEICIIKYSVQNGMEDTTIVAIDCGDLPGGYGNEILMRSENINKLEIPPGKNAMSYVQARREISEFFSGQFPNMLFALGDDKEKDLQAVHQTMLKIFEYDFIVIPVEHLFMKLHDAFGPDENTKMTVKDARATLLEIRPLKNACKYHYDLDAVVYCSEARATQIALNMADAIDAAKKARVAKPPVMVETAKENVSPKSQNLPKACDDKPSNIQQPAIQSTAAQPVETEEVTTVKPEEFEEFDLNNLPF